MAIGAMPDGTPVVVCASRERVLRIWRLEDGTPVGRPLSGHTGRVTAVAIGALPETPPPSSCPVARTRPCGSGGWKTVRPLAAL